MPKPNNRTYERWDVRKAREAAEASAAFENRPRKTKILAALPDPEPAPQLPRPPRAINKRRPLIPCGTCQKIFKQRSDSSAYCSRKCLGLSPQMRDHCRRIRKDQIAEEESTAEWMRKRGWEIYSPTVVCDRIGVKNGKVYFIEFKRHGDKLRPGQERIFTLVPRMSRIVLTSLDVNLD